MLKFFYFVNHFREIFDGELDVISAVKRDQVKRARPIGKSDKHLWNIKMEL